MVSVDLLDLSVKFLLVNLFCIWFPLSFFFYQSFISSLINSSAFTMEFTMFFISYIVKLANFIDIHLTMNGNDRKRKIENIEKIILSNIKSIYLRKKLNIKVMIKTMKTMKSLISDTNIDKKNLLDKINIFKAFDVGDTIKFYALNITDV